MLDPHAGARGFRDLRVMKILRELVSIPIGADGDGEREEGQNTGLEKLPHCNRNSGITTDDRHQAPILHFVSCRDGEFVVHVLWLLGRGNEGFTSIDSGRFHLAAKLSMGSNRGSSVFHWTLGKDAY